MRKIRIGMFFLAIVLVLSAMGYAWEVRVTNSCSTKVKLYVTGEHLFWQSKDCEFPELMPGDKAVCTMPGGICPVMIGGQYWYDLGNLSQWITLSGVHCRGKDFPVASCCWNVNVKVVTSNAYHCDLVME